MRESGSVLYTIPTHRKETKALLPCQYPLQELGPNPKVDVNNVDGIPRVTNSYLYVSPRDAQELTVYYRQELTPSPLSQDNGEVEEEMLCLRPSVTTQEIIQQTVKGMELNKDALSYRLIIKTFEFDEKVLGLEDEPLVVMDMVEDAQEGYPQIWIEEQEIQEITRTDSFMRNRSSRRGSRRRPRPPVTSTPINSENVPPLETETTPRSTSEISRIQTQLHNNSMRRRTHTVKASGEISEQEQQLKSVLVEQDKVISALSSAVSAAKTVSPSNSVKEVSQTKLKETLAEKQTQVWELEEHRTKDKESIASLTKSVKSLEEKLRETEESLRSLKQSSRHELEIEKREKRELEKELSRVQQESTGGPDDMAQFYDETTDLQDKIRELQLQVEKDQEIIDMTTRRNSDLKEEIKALKASRTSEITKLEVDGMQRSSGVMNESISINDFTEWSKDLDDLKKRNDQLIFRNKQLSSENTKLIESAEQGKAAIKEVSELKSQAEQLRESNQELSIALKSREAEIQGLNERIEADAGYHDDTDYQEKYYSLKEKNQHLESVMSGTIEKLRSKQGVVEEEKVCLQNTINDMTTQLEGKKRQLKEFEYMKNRLEMMDMEHTHLKEFSAQLIEENKGIDSLNRAIEERDRSITELHASTKDMRDELAVFRGLEKVNCAVQVDDDRVEVLESKLEEAEERVSSRTAVVENMNTRLTQKEEEVAVAKGMLSDFEQTNEMLNSELTRLKKHSSSVEGKNTRLSDEISSFKVVISALNEQIESTRSACEEQQCKSALSLKEAHQVQIDELLAASKDSAATLEKYSQAKQDLMVLQTQSSELKGKLALAAEERSEMEGRCVSQGEELRSKEEKVTELIQLTASLRDEVDRATEKNRSITAKRDELMKELTDARLQKADCELQCNEAEEELRTVRRRSKQLKEHSDSLQCLNDALTAQLQELQSNDCSAGKCPASLDLQRQVEDAEETQAQLRLDIVDLQEQRKDLQNVVIKSKNELAESQIEFQELEAQYQEVKDQCDAYSVKVKNMTRKLDPRKQKDQMLLLENEVEIYKAEVTSLKSITRQFEDEVERMSVLGQDSSDAVVALSARNSSLEKQLGDAKGEMHDLEDQLKKFKESLRDSQKESDMVDTYLAERQMLKEMIEGLEGENKALTRDKETAESSLQSLREELSIVKGVRDINTRDNVSTKQSEIKLLKEKEDLLEEVAFLREDVEAKTNESVRQVEIIERHKARTRELEIEVMALKESHNHVNGIDIVSDIKPPRAAQQQTLDGLNSTIRDLSTSVLSLTNENRDLETSISEMNEQERDRQQKIADLEEHFQREIDAVHEEYRERITRHGEELKTWVTQNKILSEEILMLEQRKEELERSLSSRGGQIAADKVQMKDALDEATTELSLQSHKAQSTLAQFEAAQHQIEELEGELLVFKKRASTTEKSTTELSRKVSEGERRLDEYKQALEELQAADENKRTEIRLLNKLVKEYTENAEESADEFAELTRRNRESRSKIEDLQREIVSLKSENTEYENVIVALESNSATDTVDNTAKLRKIQELEARLSDTEVLANRKSAELEKMKVEHSELSEENEQLLEEVKSYQDEWRRLTDLLGNVNHTNHANMSSCKRLETKLDDIEFKVSETNVHIDICQSDMFAKTEALVRDNSHLEAKISVQTASLEQSEKFLKESHENIEILHGTIADLQERVAVLQQQASQNSTTGGDVEKKVEELSAALLEKEQLLTERESEKLSDEAAFKVSLDTIVRSYEEQILSLTEDVEQKEREIERLKQR
eukprot:sb/3460665/